jgi:hypothetical protein
MTAQPRPSEFESAPYELMSTALLAQQPATAKPKAYRPNEDWNAIFSHLEARLAALRNWRYSWWAYWARLAEFFLPRRYHFLVVPNRYTKGSPINDAIIDSTGLQAVETCSSGMWAGLTNPSRPWIKLDIALPWINLDAEGKEWLEDTTERLYAVLSQSNFYTEMAQAFQDLVVFGTAPVIIYEDFEDVIRLYTPCAGEYYLAAGGRFSIDTFYDEFVLTVAQIVDRFTLEACPEQIQQLWSEGGSSLEVEFVIAWAIEPNFPLAGRGAKKEIKVVPGGFDYRELYWLRGIKTTQPLSKRGFHGKPFMAMRWSKVSNEPYGRSPCMNALGDNKQVQRETLRKAEFIEKGVRPPMGADPAMKMEPATTIPGQITYFDTSSGKKGFHPLFEVNAAWVNVLTQDIDKVNQRLEKALFVDVFMAITQMEGVQPRNELELTKRDLERLQKLGPVIDLVTGELKIGLHRVLTIMERRRMLKPVPQSLRGVPLKMEFISLARLAQRSAKSVSMKDFFATMGGLSSAAKAAGVPDPLRTINLDKAARKYADVNNVDPDILFTPQEVQEHDAARQQAMSQAQAPAQAMAGVQAAKTLADTPLGNDSALSRMLGQEATGAPA